MTATRINCTNDEYHAMNGVSNSRLSVFLDDPQLYYQRFVSKTLPPPSPTPDQKFGSDVHRHLLEGVPVVEIPRKVLSVDKNGKASRRGEVYRQFVDEHEGDILVMPDEKPMWDAIAAQVDRHPWARDLIRGDGDVEIGVEWTNADTGLLCRVKIDKHCTSHDVIVDLKTCRSVEPREFASSCLNFGYARQAAFYRESWMQLTGHLPPFLFVCIRKTPPYTVECYELDMDFIELGVRELQEALPRLAACYETGVWEAAGHGEIKTLSPPRWALYQDQWEYLA